MMKHLIGRQIFDLNISPDLDAAMLQQRVSQLCRDQVWPQLEELFNSLSDEEEIIRIDRLEIDLGQLAEQDLLMGEFVAMLRQQLENQLRDIIRNKKSPKADRLPVSRGFFEQWLFFLEKGRLPWSTGRLPDGWQPKVLETIATSSPAAQQLRLQLRSQPKSLLRLVYQHQPPFLKSLMELYSGKKQEVLLVASQEFTEWAPTLKQYQSIDREAPKDSRQASLLFWKEMLEMAIVLERRLEASTLLQRFLGGNFPIRTLKAFYREGQQPSFPVLTETIRAFFFEGEQEKELPLPPESQAPNLTQKTEKPIDDEGQPLAAEKSPPQPPKQEPFTTEPQGKPSPEEGIADEEKEEAFVKAAEERAITASTDIQEAYLQERAEMDGEEIFIENAGLILLHPFLPALFRKLELVEGKEFKDMPHRHRAIHLLQYLAVGEPAAPEYSLSLPKLLCGLPLNLPIDHTLDVTEAEQEEGEALLKAVISHWGALKRTSPAGLREGFLQRNGKLRLDSNGWQLQVEQKTQDILLNQLPWGIGMIKLPWMLDMMRVEWG